MVLSPRTTTLPKLVLKPGRWTVGSAATCNFRITGEGVQLRHALILCGPQTVILKPWDARTWCNDLTVQGEIRLQPGDRVKFGAVEFQVEASSDDEGGSTANHIPAESRSTFVPKNDAAQGTSQDIWDAQQLREQIQDLRDELARRVGRRATDVGHTAEPPASRPRAESPSVPVRSGDDATALRSRITELEQTLVDVRQQFEQVHTELQAAREQHVARESEWSAVQAAWAQERDRLTSELDQEHQRFLAHVQEATCETETLRGDLAAAHETLDKVRQEFDQLHADTVSRRDEWEQHASEWKSAQESLLAEIAALRDAVSRSETDAEQRRLEAERQQAEWASEQARLLSEIEKLEARWQQERSSQVEREQQLNQREQDLTQREQDLAQREHALTQKKEQQADWDLARPELELTKANQDREKKVLAHSWDWLQAERRKFYDEKETWQRERDEWAALQSHRELERAQWANEQDELLRNREQWQQQHAALEEFQAAQAQWNAEREQAEHELNAAADEIEATRARVLAQEQSVADEWGRLRAAELALQEIRAELDSRAVSLERERQDWEQDRTRRTTERSPAPAAHTEDDLASTADSATTVANVSPEDEFLVTSKSAWNHESAAASSRQCDSISPGPEATLASDRDSLIGPSLSDPWSTGVDLTDPYRGNWAARASEPAAVTDNAWPTDNSSGVDVEPPPLPPPLPPLDTDEVLSRKPTPGRLWTRPLSEATSLQVFVEGSEADLGWTTAEPKSAVSLSDFVVANASFTLQAWTDSTSPDVEPAASDAAASDVEIKAAALRSQLAEIFHLPDLAKASPQVVAPKPNTSRITIDLDPGKVDAGFVQVVDGSRFARETASPEIAAAPLTLGDDSETDDSVSRYMQHLLARSRSRTTTENTELDADSRDDSLPPVPTDEQVVAELAAERQQRLNGSMEGPLTPLEPVHKQDKRALRSATEQMREVANLQTRKNVETSSWSQLKMSIKTKSCLAAFAFVVSMGLLFLGFQGQPVFYVLGACSACVGMLTWVDLFVAVRAARCRTAQLSDAKKRP